MSRCIPAILVAFLALPSPVRAGDESPFPVEDTLKPKSITSVLVSPGGSRAAVVVRELLVEKEKSEALTHVHLAPADGTKRTIQLTRGDKSCDSPAWSSDGKRLLFVSDRSGKRNVFVIGADGGEAERVTDVQGAVSAAAFSPDGKTIAFVAADGKPEERERLEKEKDDARVVDSWFAYGRLYVVPAAAGADGKREARCLTKDLARHVSGSAFAWSPDGRSIVFSHARTPVVDDWPTADLSIVDVESGEIRGLAATGAAESSPVFSPDGIAIAFTISEDPVRWGGGSRIAIVAASGGTPRELAETWDGQPSILGFSSDGSRVFFDETRGTTIVVGAVPVDGGPAVEIGRAEAGSLGNVSMNSTGTHFGFTLEDGDVAPEANVSPTGRFAPLAVSEFNAGLPEHRIGRTETIRWKAPDGLDIEGLLTYPAGHEAGTKAPLLLVIHGGPAGVFRRSYLGSASPYPIGVFSANGFAVLRVNPRGSSGYGVAFRRANEADWGGRDFEDLMSGVDKVVAMGVADPERLGVMGWSYGGFMTSWVIGQTNRFKAASIGAAVTNLVSFNGTTDIPSFVPNYFLGEFWDRFETWVEHSPIFHVKNAKTRALIQHGESDDRVPVSQGYEIYTALKRRGVPVEMVVYPRAPHGPREPKQLLDAARRNVEFFEKHVKGIGEAAASPAGH